MTDRPFACRLGLCVAAMAVLAAGPAKAHHSFNAYDMRKTKTVSATIKEFRWGAPHSSVAVIYVDKNKKQQVMSLISGSPLSFSKQGLAPRDFRSGDKVIVTYHPTTSGAPGGALAMLSVAGGKTYKDAEVSAAAASLGVPGTSGN
ncbi:hypothetical protein WSK_1032 [Novosphingobium sp. Rr 2-17]|uniref:DUF6152 family protein n=1 Tax=Novosphingobium sp. Rr 2-17 TaxID=555793 RepID=UPI0002699B68|nr:DUF6152 family protein [Novosphingobium sp. Rr 2-17]EIZ80471.1 hypothetical protein WSK_1032 [Novosphingobium sp. Rr 2-17]